MTTMPHCDQRVLHAPGECEYCDAFPTWQEARRMWGIAFTGQPPTDAQPLPCPSEVARDIDTVNRWPGNRPTSPPAAADVQDDWSMMTVGGPSQPMTTTTPTVTFTDGQLGRPNIPVLRKDLEAMIRETVKDILHEMQDPHR